MTARGSVQCGDSTTQMNGSSRSRFLLVIALGAMLFALGCNDAPVLEDVDRRPVGTLSDLATLKDVGDLNVLFIVVDTLRSDRLSAYGYERDTTPVLRYFSSKGIRFDDHWAQSSWTKTSMASLWTSLYPIRTGVLNHRHTVAPAAIMPAEIFRDAGYTTAGIWRNGWIAPNFGFGQGFDVYQAPAGKQAPKTMRRAPSAGRIDGTDIDLVFSATEFMRANGDRPWLLYLHMMDVHQYITTPDNAIFGDSYSDAYDNSIRWTDEQIGMILRSLHQLHLADRTLVVIVSDHGEAFGEHGSEGHARNVFSEVVRTPFILIPPFQLEQGVSVPFSSQNIDVWPTLLDLAGLSIPDEVDGRSLVPLLTERQPLEGEGFTVSQLDHAWGKKAQESTPSVGLRQGRYRLIRDSRSPGEDQLYDVEIDSGEFQDISASSRGIVEELGAQIDEYMTQSAPWDGGAPEIELDEMHLRQLRALGYSIEE
jgi:arylsulfatase A-like enzyme